MPNSSVSDHFCLSHDFLDRLHCSGIMPINVCGGDMVTLVHVKHIMKKAIFVEFCGKTYVSTFPNNIIDD